MSAPDRPRGPAALPADTCSEPGLLGRATFDELARANAMRYSQGSNAFVEVADARSGNPSLVEEHRKADTWLASEMTHLLSLLGITVGGIPVVFLVQHAALVATLFGLVAVGFLGLSIANLVAAGVERRRKDALDKSRAATVLSPVAEAYRRLQSAADEVADSEREHGRDAIASVRLAAEGAREIVSLLHGHHEAGTLGSTAARSLTVEIYRLASEVDAYLMLHDANTRFAPGEDDAFGVIAATGQLTFKPREIES